LTGRVPELHGHDSVVDDEFSGEKVGAWLRFDVKGMCVRVKPGMMINEPRLDSG
jgi:hypothetical protein